MVEPDDAADHGCQHADQQRNLAAEHQSHQLVAPGFVGAQRVFGEGGAYLRQQVGLVRIDVQQVRDRHGRGDEDQQQRQHEQARHAGAVPSEAPPAQPPRRDRAIGDRGAHSEIRGSSQA